MYGKSRANNGITRLMAAAAKGASTIVVDKNLDLVAGDKLGLPVRSFGAVASTKSCGERRPLPSTSSGSSRPRKTLKKEKQKKEETDERGTPPDLLTL